MCGELFLSTALVHNQSFTLFGFEKENFQNIDFSSLWRKSVRGKIWEGNYRVHSVCFQPPSVAANQNKWSAVSFAENLWITGDYLMALRWTSWNCRVSFRVIIESVICFRIVCYFFSSCHSFTNYIASLQSVFRNLKKSFLAAL